MQQIKIKILQKATAKDCREMNHLLSQLSLGSIRPSPLTQAQFSSLLGQKNVFLLAAMSSGSRDARIIGFVLLYFVKIPSGFLAVSEDLIVDEPYRKWGVGRLLMEYSIECAEKKGARHISLRTNPKRADAKKLYEQMGFIEMPTHFFRINLPRKK